LIFLIKTSAKTALAGGVVVFGTGLNLMDQLAYILAKNIDLANQASSLVICFIRKVMEMLGMNKALEAADMTREFIRSILVRLQNKIYSHVRPALLTKI